MQGRLEGEAGGDGRAGPQRALFARGCGVGAGAVWARGGGGGRRGRAGGLSTVRRVGSSLRGQRGQRGDKGDPGQGPTLGLLAARGISRGPQAPGSAPLSSRSVLGRRGFGGDSPCWVRAVWARQSAGREALVRRCLPRGFLTGRSPEALEEPWGGRVSFHHFPTPPPTTLRLSASPLLALKKSQTTRPSPPGQPGSVCSHPTPSPCPGPNLPRHLGLGQS